jgi:hypothetical protein
MNTARIERRTPIGQFRLFRHCRAEITAEAPVPRNQKQQTEFMITDWERAVRVVMNKTIAIISTTTPLQIQNCERVRPIRSFS